MTTEKDMAERDQRKLVRREKRKLKKKKQLRLARMKAIRESLEIRSKYRMREGIRLRSQSADQYDEG